MAVGFRAPLLPLALSIPIVQEPGPLNLLSIFSQQGVQVIFSDPIFKPGRRSYITSLTNYDSYSHEVRATGGFWSASISTKVDLNDALDWLTNGVGRHVVTLDQAQETIFEGFVDRITLGIGRLEYSIGPLISKDIGNKIRIKYSLIDYSISPPSTGLTLISAYVNNLDSQNRYGIIERTLSANEVTETLAQTIRDSWIDEHTTPRISVRSSSSNNTDPTLTIECLGYWHYLDTWNYSESDTGGISVTDKIIAIMDSSINSGLFSDDYGKVDTNALEVKAYETGDRSPMSILTELVTYGDSSNRRYTIGLGQDRQIYYTVMPETVEYYQHFDGSVRALSGYKLYPWQVKPGKWVLYAGLLPASYIPNSLEELRKTPACAFVEGVTFSTPYNMDVNTAFASKLDQLFARMGISGV